MGREGRKEGRKGGRREGRKNKDGCGLDFSGWQSIAKPSVTSGSSEAHWKPFQDLDGGLGISGQFQERDREKHSILLGLQEGHWGPWGRRGGYELPHRFAQRETFFLSDSFGGEPVESGREERLPLTAGW